MLDKMGLILKILILFLCFCYVHSNIGKLTLKLDKKTGMFSLSLAQSMTLTNMDVFVMYNGSKYSVTNGRLNYNGSNVISGMDTLGHWTGVKSFWRMTKDIGFKTVIKNYNDHPTITFGQIFEDALPNTSTGNQDQLISGFPCFTINARYDPGYLSFGGYFLGDQNLASGVWNNKDVKKISSGLASGPLVLFDGNQSSTIVSSFINPMASSAVYDTSGDTPTSSWGIMGKVESIPKDFEHWTILQFSDKGINRNFDSWGSFLRKYYRKDPSFREADLANNYIGYWTDNGAFYYYQEEPGENYQTTILDLYKYIRQSGIPYRYIEFDSWWYPKGPNGGVKEWVPMSEIFPDGLKYLWAKTGFPVVAHNKWWSYQTTYAKVNGGNYNFIVESNTSKMSVPDDKFFWRDLFKAAKEWGLLTYEQDWLSQAFHAIVSLRTNATLGRTWLTQMGAGASMNGITIQYCTADSRMVLQALDIPAVTQARVSVDYQPGNSQWKIGITSMFAHHIGIAPFKDNFWTTTNQPGNTYKLSEPYPELQSLVATLSTGPVGPSDKIGYSNVSLIMKSCNSDGLILKPSLPAMAIDQQIVSRAFQSFHGEVWSTYSEISGLPFGIFFGADFSTMDAIYLTPSDLSFYGEFPSSKVFSLQSPRELSDFSYISPIKMSACTKAQFCLFYTSPVINLQEKVLVLHGELDKWVPMSPKRVSNIFLSSEDVEIELRGGIDEEVLFMYTFNGLFSTTHCVLSQKGQATISIVKNECISI